MNPPGLGFICCLVLGIVLLCPADVYKRQGKNNVSKVVTQLLSSDHMPTAIACQEDGIRDSFR